MRASVFIATSLDGFIARTNGDIDWLDIDQAETAAEGVDHEADDHGYQAFLDSVDALVMGRHSYEKVLSFGIEWPYADKPVIVLSSQAIDIPEAIRSTVEVLNLSPSDLCDELERRGMNHLYIDGGRTIQGFLAAGLIQRMIITTIPVLIGTGIPLFGALESDVKLRLVEARGYKSGFAQSTYDVINN